MTNERDESSRPARRPASRRGGSSAKSRGRSKDAGSKKGLIIGVVIAVLATLGVVFGLMSGSGDEKDDRTPEKSPKEQAAAPLEDQTPAGGNGGGDRSIFDATAGDTSPKSGEPVRVTGRDPETVKIEKLTTHLGHLYLAATTADEIKALEKEVKRFRRERWDISKELKAGYKSLVSKVSTERNDPFKEAADSSLNIYNIKFKNSDLHLRDENDKLFANAFVGFVREPYAFYVQASKEGGEEEIVDKMHGLLTQLQKGFTDYFGAFIDLKPSETNNVIKIMLFRSLKDYQTYNRIKEPERDRTFALAHYEPKSRMLCVPLKFGGRDAEHKLREVMFHEGTHQLLHYFTDFSHLGAWGSMWSDEGVAEFFGGHSVDGDGNIAFGKINSRIASIAADQKNPKLRISMKELITWTRFKFEDRKSENKEAEAQNIHSHVYSQGWALVHFFNFYKNGLYKKQFQEIMRRQIKDGDAGMPVFRAVLGDLYDKIEVEFDEYQDWLTDAFTQNKIKNHDIVE